MTTTSPRVDINSLKMALENKCDYETPISKSWLIREDLLFYVCKDNADVSVENAIEDTSICTADIIQQPKWAIIGDQRKLKQISSLVLRNTALQLKYSTLESER